MVIIGRLLVISFIALTLFFAFGIGVIFWQSYQIARKPVYRTTMRHIEFVNDVDREMLLETLGDIEPHEFQCFVFQDHTQRPIYQIILIGKADDKLGQVPSTKSISLSESRMTRVFHALKFSGANPTSDDAIRELAPYGSIYAYGNWLVITKAMPSPVFLTRDDQKLELLNSFIRSE